MEFYWGTMGVLFCNIKINGLTCPITKKLWIETPTFPY